ncbi:glycoside hydrolase family 3 N-terminal domain-containing protein [Paraclostridium ghonii]|uniref:beta-N-acetylhexosaminidase n=1 Tax=Paraclostridium ghonii TaxID=29358 RepID=A0ABU0MYZ4_9FIRM|nr:glycoside hydrolase family 3 N-terminal domain-containing protein [Paeniclostridium ghonii]MDQ0556141.1 beta-N-acetylhexosaminidase [Paeniclostridium ghonii]
MIDLRGKPFYLSDDDIKWVEKTLEEMDLYEKVGQLFCIIGLSHEEDVLKKIMMDIKPGGIMFRPDNSEKIAKTHSIIQGSSKIPLLISANLEEGGSGIANDFTSFSSQMGVAATNDTDYAYKLGHVASTEGSVVGCNITFSPVVDINFNFRNPITNIRAYSDQTCKVLEMSKSYIKAMQDNNMGVTIKHFPGDGVDERDHHLVTSVNSLSVKDWDDTFGKVYKELIEMGAQSVMVGHITLPSYQKHLNPLLEDKDILPASLSKELLNGLLRKKLNFNGLIITDSSLMMGLYSAMERKKAVPMSIAAGCDMFLFARDLKEDFGYMLQGVKDGLISKERLDEAVTRILALKASLGLHLKKENNHLVFTKEDIENLDIKTHKKWSRDCIKKSITLVKDTQNLLPIDSKRYKNILIYKLGWDNTCENKNIENKFISELEENDFRVGLFDTKKAKLTSIISPIEEFKKKYDLVIYLADKKPISNITSLRLGYNSFFGADFAFAVNEVPTLFISFGSPYHLQDMPMMKTFINCYNNNEVAVEEVVKKLIGKGLFTGVSPVDSFCGMWDTKL